MRFRHKLSIVLVGLAIVPLAAAGVLVGALLQRDQVTQVDNRLSVVAAAAAAGVHRPAAEGESVRPAGRCAEPRCASAFASRHASGATESRAASGMAVVLVDNGKSASSGAVRRGRPGTRRPTSVGKPPGRKVDVYVPLTSGLLDTIETAGHLHATKSPWRWWRRPRDRGSTSGAIGPVSGLGDGRRVGGRGGHQRPRAGRPIPVSRGGAGIRRRDVPLVHALQTRSTPSGCGSSCRSCCWGCS